MSPTVAAPVFHPLDLAGVIVFATGAFLAFFLTAFPPMTERTWLAWVGARVAWHLGGALWLGVAVAGMAHQSRLLGALAGIPLGFLLCFNAVFDLVKGPRRVDGVVEVDEDRRLVMGTGSGWVWSDVKVRAEDGTLASLRFSGIRANRWQAFRETWTRPHPRVHLVVLDHLGVPLALTCVEDSHR